MALIKSIFIFILFLRCVLSQAISFNSYHAAFQSWGENLSLTNESTQKAYDLTFRSYGFKLGLTRNWISKSETFYFAADADLIIGSARIQESTLSTLQSPIHYFYEKSAFFGASLEPKFFFFKDRKKNFLTSFGFGIPILFRHAFWEDPSAGYTLSGHTNILYGLTFISRLDFNHFKMSQEFGFLKVPKYWFFSVGIETLI